MAILGLRCSNSDYAYAVVDGTAASPKVIDEKLVIYPKDYPNRNCFAGSTWRWTGFWVSTRSAAS